MVSQAAICGHDGNIWATSTGFAVTAAELKHLSTNFGNMDVLPMSGLNLAGTKFMFLSANDRVMRGKKGTSGVHIMKTVQAIIVSVYHEPIVPEQVCVLMNFYDFNSNIFSAPTPRKSLEST